MTDFSAIALLSGGLDSATAAALAQEAGGRVIGLSFDYGQRHRRELQAAAAIAEDLKLAEVIDSEIEIVELPHEPLGLELDDEDGEG